MTESVEGNSAKTFALVGFIFYLLGFITNLIPLLIFLPLRGMMMGGGPFRNEFADISFGGFFPIVFPFGIFLALTAGFTVWSWITYDNIRKGKYAEARTATLILGTFGIFLAWLIGGILLILAYSKLGDVMKERQTAQVTQKPTGRMCPKCGRPIDWEAKFCEHCGKKLG